MLCWADESILQKASFRSAGAEPRTDIVRRENDSRTHTLFVDPFYRRYCGADWFGATDFDGADYIAVTHGHEEHFLDVPLLAKLTGATVIGSAAATSFLQ